MLSPTEAKPSLLKISDKLSVRFQKTGSGPPLLLIHTVYSIDLPGHGHSPN
ncbi:pimeloyl-ACP methyl ester carboxylesterase [Bradyrhizobium sp. S3.3.6]